MSAHNLDEHLESMFTPTDAASKAAKFRMVPKENGKFRPIIAFKRNPFSEEGSRLRTAFHVLKYFYEYDSSISVIGFSQTQSRLIDYKIKMRSFGPFYMAALDISSCFDSIPHEKLLKLLTRLIKGQEFGVKNVDILQLDLITGKPRRIVSRCARPVQSASGQAVSKSFSCVAVDKVVCKFFDGHEIMAAIEDHLLNNVVMVIYLTEYYLVIVFRLRVDHSDKNMASRKVQFFPQFFAAYFTACLTERREFFDMMKARLS